MTWREWVSVPAALAGAAADAAFLVVLASAANAGESAPLRERVGAWGPALVHLAIAVTLALGRADAWRRRALATATIALAGGALAALAIAPAVVPDTPSPMMLAAQPLLPLAIAALVAPIIGAMARASTRSSRESR